jgi:hypothetical protein
MSKQVCVMVVGQCLPQDLLDRFEACVHKSNPSVSYDVQILKTQDPSQTPMRFNKSKLLNKGIKKFCDTNIYDVVIQTDIDLIVPPGLIDKSYEVAMSGRYCYHANHVRVTYQKFKGFPSLPEEYDNMNWSIFKDMKHEPSNGCWNAIQSSLWWDTGGFNENCVNYSKEDDDWAKRSKIYGKIQFKVSNAWPLVHMNHPQRNINNRRHNNAVIDRAIAEGKTNWLI